jgi:purine-binding chemotaxis protein CheW
MSTQTLEAPNISGRARAGKYLTFQLGHEFYGVEVLQIREIIRLIDITPVPQMPDYIKGVVNLRGKIIPVVDLRLKFGLTEIQANERTCIVVVQLDSVSGVATRLGLVVDGVEEVVNIAASEIETTPNFGSSLDTDYFSGMAKIKGSLKTLLNINRVLQMDAAVAEKN